MVWLGGGRQLTVKLGVAEHLNLVLRFELECCGIAKLCLLASNHVMLYGECL
jgi:hypothetical protein